MYEFILLFAIFTLCSIVHVGSMAAVGVVFRAPIAEISLFCGPRVFGTTIRDVRLSIRGIPLGGFVRFAEPPDERFHAGYFSGLQRWKQAVILASGNATLLAIALLVRGTSAIASFATGFGQAIRGALSPSLGKTLILELAGQFEVHHLAFVAALMCAKIAAMNMLPLPSLNGGAIILAMLGVLQRPPSPTIERIQMIGFAILLFIFIGWIGAAFRAVATLFGGA